MQPVTAPWIDLPYLGRRHKFALFEFFAEKPWSILLDSGDGEHPEGRYDILVSDPVATLTADHGKVRVRRGTELVETDDPALQVLRQLCEQQAETAARLPDELQHLPYHGGALGYFSYDFGRSLEQLPSLAKDELPVPEVALGFYPWAYLNDHRLHRSYLVNFCLATPDWQRLCTLFNELSLKCTGSDSGFHLTGTWQPDQERSQYETAFARVQEYIHAGDCYQVNLAQRFSAPFEGSAWQAYKILSQSNQAPFSAYLNLGDFQILSVSPERFIQVEGTRIVTQPIKGTRPRSRDPEADAVLARELQASDKDRAENLMIVDLMRNDIGRNARTGSVRVSELFGLQSFHSVHHLVSTIEAELAEGRDALDLLAGSFPGGSITGAPKIRAMEIIEELETHRRTVYCGSIGYIDFRGRLDTSIAIRTLVSYRQTLYAWGGGGLVADSQVDEEYQEIFDKLSRILPPLEQELA